MIGTAKHIGVSTYERLFELTYSSFGFSFVSINMIMMAHGGCLRECLTAACKALSLANAKGKGTNGLVIGSLD